MYNSNYAFAFWKFRCQLHSLSILLVKDLQLAGHPHRRFYLFDEPRTPLRRAFGATFQSYINYAFTLTENIAITSNKNGGYTEDEIAKALKISTADDIVSKMKNGLDTYVQRIFDKNGYEPSSGEQQKIALARTLSRDADIFVFDEPSSALDPRSERNFFTNLKSELKTKMLIFTSHRLSAVHIADKIILLEKGRIVALGTHNQLISESEKYSSLYNLTKYNFTED